MYKECSINNSLIHIFFYIKININEINLMQKLKSRVQMRNKNTIDKKIKKREVGFDRNNINEKK